MLFFKKYVKIYVGGIMRDIQFETKYNNFNLSIINPNTYGFKLIDQIHNYLFDFNEPYSNVRIQTELIDKLNDQINSVMKKRFRGILSDEIDELLKVVAIIRLYQPFYDGNRRTCFLLLKYFFDNNNLTFLSKLDENFDDFIYELIPIIYSENESINNKYKKRILSFLK